ncbi:methylisocitrate lyase [Gammaproteobacteria bacterium]|nr:methylisocitrate lyase [Gammaproteobacteria bacterium]MDA7856114.1 methylisocitrate lyase [Gammaproteobacteria bacterium]MDA8957435.1 methylisocitrate lyase [Gammaproteobacteria bacterium]MDA9039033.1 methylisocitrate lyase [Gammaproteobacteria bacterium]MDA9045182.1 methylisocitrate lyase [Gammaproteobacteria bacterium]
MSSGTKFRKALAENNPLIIPGAINAYSAILAEKSGHQALYLSGGGVAAASYGMPDLGITSMEDVLIDVKRITDASSLPLLVDIDTGWGGAFNISRTIKEMIQAGAAAVHIEDQISQKRCGHRPNKSIVSSAEMEDRIKAAVDGRTDESFFIMARTDSFASEGMSGAIERAESYIEQGADGIFLEAVSSLDDYKMLKESISAPVLANITEFGKTPLFSANELSSVGVDMVLFPLSAFRAMSQIAEKVYISLAKDGTQEPLLDIMQTRDELYERLNYHEYEEKLDELFLKK